MAFTVPERLTEQNDTVTNGERKVFAALRQHLPEDYLVYYDIRVGDRYPDFTVIGPDLGVVVLEVKDWRLKSIVGAQPDSVVIKTSDGEHVVRSPIPQAREYTIKIVDCLKRRPKLRNGERLCCAWGFGAVLPLLKTEDVRTPSLFGASLEETLGVPSLRQHRDGHDTPDGAAQGSEAADGVHHLPKQLLLGDVVRRPPIARALDPLTPETLDLVGGHRAEVRRGPRRLSFTALLGDSGPVGIFSTNASANET